MSIKNYVTGKVKFLYYRKGELYYQCENGFIFPVPIDASFNSEDKAILFMRWIRKALDSA
jgi:hypothetical protein